MYVSLLSKDIMWKLTLIVCYQKIYGKVDIDSLLSKDIMWKLTFIVCYQKIIMWKLTLIVCYQKTLCENWHG